MKEYFILIVLILFISGCDFNLNNSYEKNSYSSYLKQYASIFDDSLINHFPKEVNGLYNFFHNRSRNQDFYFTKRNSLILSRLVTEKELELIKIQVSNSLTIVDPNDSCLLIVGVLDNISSNNDIEFKRRTKIRENKNYEREFFERLKKVSIYRKNNCKELAPPVPNFSAVELDDYKMVNVNRLTEDFKLYILSAKAGNYIENEYLTKGYGLPDEWKNGYSKGIAISESRNIVIYWIEVW